MPSLKEALNLILDMHGPSVVCISVVFLGLRRKQQEHRKFEVGYITGSKTV